MCPWVTRASFQPHPTTATTHRTVTRMRHRGQVAAWLVGLRLHGICWPWPLSPTMCLSPRPPLHLPTCSAAWPLLLTLVHIFSIMGTEPRAFRLSYSPSSFFTFYSETGSSYVTKLPRVSLNLRSSRLSLLRCCDYRPVPPHSAVEVLLFKLYPPKSVTCLPLV